MVHQRGILFSGSFSYQTEETLARAAAPLNMHKIAFI